MAQTKQQKQLKVLKYWEDELSATHTLNSQIPYIKSQIRNLTRNIVDPRPYTKTDCPMCHAKWIRLSPDHMLCPLCRKAFDGVALSITNLANGIHDAGMIMSETAHKFSSILANSTYGFPTKPPNNPYKG